jgi:hypothetical protein
MLNRFAAQIRDVWDITSRDRSFLNLIGRLRVRNQSPDADLMSLVTLQSRVSARSAGILTRSLKEVARMTKNYHKFLLAF